MFGSQFKLCIVLCHNKPFEFLDSDLSVGSCCVTKKTFEILDPDLKALDPRKLLKKDGCMEKVRMKTILEHLRTIYICSCVRSHDFENTHHYRPCLSMPPDILQKAHVK